jgi:peroxiredoxin/cytochrome c biogenesis protein CcdA
VVRLKVFKAVGLSLFIGLILLLVFPIVRGDLAPDFTLTDIDGETFSLADFRGKVVILEFFATYCGSCTDEIPHLKAVQNEFSTRVVIISISTWSKDTDEKLRQFREDYDIAWIVARDTASVRENYNVSGIPTLYVIDQEGQIKHQHIDEVVVASVLKEEVSELLTFSLTVTTSPSLDDVHFGVDGDDYYTSGGSFSVELEVGQHQVELVDTVIREGEDTEYRFSNWSGIHFGFDNPIQIYITNSSVLEANFNKSTTDHNETQHYVTVISAHGSPTPSQWVDEGDDLNASVTSPAYNDVEEMRYRCTGYRIDGGSLQAGTNYTFANIQASHEIEFQWISQYYLTMNASQVDLTSQLDVSPSGPWYDVGTIVTCTAQTINGYDFDYWILDGTPQELGKTQLVITMDMPHTAISHYTTCTHTPGSTAPDFTLTDIDDIEFSLRDYRGKPVLLDFFATLCSGCRAEIPHLKALHEEFSEDLIIISISIDPYSDTVENLRQFRQEYELDWIIARDTEGVNWNYGVTSIPAIVIISQEGYVKQRYTGLTDESVLREEILAIGPGTIEGEGLSLGFSWLMFVLAAGASALLSPCGYALLPGYISYYVGTETSLRKVLPNGVACTLGLISMFSVIGLLASALGSLISPYVLTLNLIAGLTIIFLGISMLVKIRFPMIPVKAPKRKGPIGIFLYGVVYGLAALGCSAPIFFSILFYAATAGGALFGLVIFIIYALGMSIPLVITTILVAMAKEFLLKRITQITPWIQKISGIVLIIIGAYLTYIYYTVVIAA